MTILRLKILSKMIFLNDFNVFVRDNPKFYIFFWGYLHVEWAYKKKGRYSLMAFFFTSNALTTRAWELVDRVYDSDSRLWLPSFSDSWLFHPKKPTDSRLLSQQIFEPEKNLENWKSNWESGVRHFCQLPTPYPKKSTDSRLPSPADNFLTIQDINSKLSVNMHRVILYFKKLKEMT